MQSLQSLIDSKPNLVEYFYNDTISQFHRSRTDLFASKNLISREYSNWREEQKAWRTGVALMNQTHHMPVLYVRGPDAAKMLECLSPVSFRNVSPKRAKQYFGVTPRGHHIGDCLMYYHGEAEGFELISGMPILNWVRFNAESGRWKVELEFDPTTPYSPTGKRTKYRFQLAGATAWAVLNDLCDGGFPELKPFQRADTTIANRPVHALRHTMAGHAGAELSGPFEDSEIIREAILSAGKRHGLCEVGTQAYFTSSLEDGWIAYPLPGIYTGDELRPYREWLPATSWEGNMQLAGSMYTNNIEDYYWTPSSLGYDKLVKFDHDFVGRKALELALDGPRRVKRVLHWRNDDVLKVLESQISDGPMFKSIEMPAAYFGFPQADVVRSEQGDIIGMSQLCGYNINEKAFISLCQIDEAFAEAGTEVILTWGEIGGGSRKPHVERHDQTKIRAKVALAPFARSV